MNSRARVAVAVLLLAEASTGHAIQIDWDIGEGITGTLNNSFSVGGQWRMEERDPDLVGKMKNNNQICPVAPNGAGTTCQGHLDRPNPLHQTLNLNSYVGEGESANQAAVNAPGQFSNNTDDGNMNFDKGDITQAIAKISSDLTLTYKEYTLFVRGYAFYDNVNEHIADFTPNGVTQAGIDRRGTDRSYYGDPSFFDHNSRTRKQNGKAFRLLDANISHAFPFVGERELSVKIGKQAINWGESTLLIVNSLNTFNPPNVNTLFRPAFLDLAEVLEPFAAVQMSTNVTESLTAEIFYQLAWEPAQIPAPGSYLSTVDVGSDNARDYIHIDFGKGPENPEALGRADQIMLSAVTDSTGTIKLLDEERAKDSGQGGLALRYYAENLNGGTELGFYAANYHSRLPYVSFLAGQHGCLSGPNAPAPAPLGPTKNVLDVVNTLAVCPGADAALFVESALPAGVAPPVREQNIGPDGNAFPGDSIMAQLGYPEDIQVYGMSFNTNFGELAVQGEIAYRPKAPLQVDDTDLAFAALQNIFPRGNGLGDETDRYDFGVPGVGTVAQLPGARYGVPDFVSKYRGRDPLSYAPGELIRGWEYFKTAQYNVGGTYIIGPNNWIKADQIIVIGEVGATQVFDLPSLDELQIEGPGTFTHASAGTDGTGADGSARSNSGVIGPSGIRFNPTQQREGFADDFSYGYRILSLIRYPNIRPGVNLEPTIVWMHDIDGTAPGPGENFIEGRKNLIANMELRLGQSWTFALGYAAFFDGGKYNLLGDRDFLNAGMRYQF